jgi:hypothetical protein
MARPRADNWSSHLLEAEELATDRDRWREVVVTAKDLNGLY